LAIAFMMGAQPGRGKSRYKKEQSDWQTGGLEKKALRAVRPPQSSSRDVLGTWAIKNSI
jgi:hypothetical protein